MGLGKTFVGSEKAIQFRKNILVVCQKSKIDDWVNHFIKYYSEHPYLIEVFDLTNKKDFERYINLMIVKDELNPCYFIGVINYELAFKRKELLQLENFTLMLDESSMIQNDTNKRTKFVLKLNSSNVILLSGTPTSGKYENLWSQAHLLGWNISKDIFNKQYINWVKVDHGGFIHKIVDKENPYKNIDRLKDKFRQYGAVFMKTEEVMDLPEQNFIDVKVKTSKEYNKFMKNSIVTLGDIEFTEGIFEEKVLVGDTSLTKLIYSRMLCGQYNKDKLEAFNDLISSTQDRLIVFYNFNEELEQLKNIVNEIDRPISEINGHVKDLSNYENEDNSITFVQYQSGAMGLNLQKANKIIYFTPTLSCELWMQSQKRIHRIGQGKPCYYYKLICENSVEEKIYESLKNGVDYTDYLFEQGAK